MRLCRSRALALCVALGIAGLPHVGSTQTAIRAAADTPDKAEPLPALDKRLMDTSVDPCVDFAAYACGNFSKVHPMPPDRSTLDSFDLMYERTEPELRGLLEKVAGNDAKRTPDNQKIGDFYATCMDEEAINKQGLEPFEPELKRISALKDKRELTALLAHFQLINVNAFVGVAVLQDFKDATKEVMFVDQSGLGLPERDYYFRTGDAAETTRKQYVDHMANVFKLLGEPEDRARADARKVMDLETALAKVSMDITSRRDPKNIYHPMSVEKLSGLTTQVDWPRFFAGMDIPVSNVVVANPDFMTGLEKILEATDLDTIKTYLRWQLIRWADSTTLPKALDDEVFDFFQHKLNGQPIQRPRWKRCVDATDGAVGEALGQLYVAAYFPQSSKDYTVQLVRDIENALDGEIDGLDWMNSETRIKAKAKLHKVANKVAYPDHWRDYSNLKIVRGDALGNQWRAVEFENRRQFAKIGKPVDRSEFGMTPPTVNAYYNPSMNDINFPAGILQMPFYDPGATDAENYGHIGAIVGHELTHGFDDQGSKFDGNGNLVDWWTPDDEKKFDSMTNCAVQEYGSFTAVDDVKVNGKLTAGENVADNGGLRIAFLAFLADAKRKGVDITAKQDGFTFIQQFFLSYGQNWCADLRPEQVRLQVQTDPHSPDRFRINGVVQNMQEFGQAFGCKSGQPMMPANACHIW
jgi:putative endopeptidase